MKKSTSATTYVSRLSMPWRESRMSQVQSATAAAMPSVLGFGELSVFAR